jgi:dihydrofolate synthase/folylpolyglutamate synthase
MRLEGLEAPALHINSVAAAMQAWQLLFNTDADRMQTLACAAHRACLQGRWQTVYSANSNTFILDVAHNPAAARYFCSKLRQVPGSGKIHAVWAMRENKDMRGFVEALAAEVDTWYPVHVADSGMAEFCMLRDAVQVTQGRLSDAEWACSGDLYAILNGIDQNMAKSDVTLVCGSFALASECLNWLEAGSCNTHCTDNSRALAC